MAKKHNESKISTAPNKVTFVDPIYAKKDKSDSEPESDEPDGKDNSNLYFGIGILLMVSLLAGVFALNAFYTPAVADTSLLTDIPDVKSFEYNNFTFNYWDGKWHVSLYGVDNKVFDVPLKFSPKDVGNVDIRGTYDESFGFGGVHITFDPNSDVFSFLGLSAAELTLSLTGVMNIQTTGACTTHDTEAAECLDKPIITCNSEDISVILLKDSDVLTPSVTYNDNCIVLEGNNFDLLKAADRMLYSWFNILPYNVPANESGLALPLALE